MRADDSFATRLRTMGDIAENAFEAWASLNAIPSVRYGLNRPPISVAKLPPFIRYTPDYLTAGGLFEVQGCGTDGTIKLKEEKLAALLAWDSQHVVYLWCWHQPKSAWCYARITTVAACPHGSGAFPEGKAYLAIPFAELAVAAENGSGDSGIMRWET